MSSGPYYTEDKDDWLRSNYPHSKRIELLNRFPSRTLGSIRQRAWFLGIRKDKAFLDYGPEITTMIGHLSETEKAYLAGIIDGEGCIMLAKRKPIGKWNPVYAVHVSIANTSPALHKWLETHMPNTGIYDTKHHDNPKWRDRWQWVLSGNRQCIVFLKEISPYLVIKREQAELLSGGYISLDEEQRNTLYMRLRSLKRTS